MQKDRSDIVGRIAAIVADERAEMAREPDWIPASFLRRQFQAREDLRRDGMSDTSIAKAVAQWIRNPDKVTVPGVVLDSIAFLQRIDLLAQIERAKALGPEQGLKMLAGDAVKSRGVMNARKAGQKSAEARARHGNDAQAKAFAELDKLERDGCPPREMRNRLMNRLGLKESQASQRRKEWLEHKKKSGPT